MLSSVLCKLPPCRSSSEERAAHAHDARQAAPPSTAHWPCHRVLPPPVLMTTRRARPASLAQPYRPPGASAGACARSGRDGTLPGSAVLGHVHRRSGVGWDGNEQAAASQISRSHMLPYAPTIDHCFVAREANLQEFGAFHILCRAGAHTVPNCVANQFRVYPSRWFRSISSLGC